VVFLVLFESCCDALIFGCGLSTKFIIFLFLLFFFQQVVYIGLTNKHFQHEGHIKLCWWRTKNIFYWRGCPFLSCCIF